jgi:tetratricopeptide (TPR) repeat protein
MALSKDEMLQQAVQAGQTGDLARARELLLKLLQIDNREPLYWLLMSTAVESREERIYCLHSVLFLDPENSATIHDLELLGAEIPKPDAPALVPEEQPDWQTSEIAAPKVRKKKTRKKEEPWSPSWILGSLGLGLVIILLGFYAARQGLLPGLIDEDTETPGASSSQQANNGLTPTPRPTATRSIAITPRDPNELLVATYTPTPMYVGTPHADSPVFQQAMTAYNGGDYVAAADLFEQFLASSPQSADGAYYLGESRLRSGDAARAQAAFTQAISSDPQFAPGYLGRARALVELESVASSILTDLNTALLLDPNLIDAYIERAAFNLSRANPVAALADLEDAEERAPQNALVQYQKARVYLAQLNYAQALRASQTAYELDMTLLPNYLVLAEAQQGVGEFTDSIEIMQRYLGFEGEDGAGWQLLGMGYQLSGEEERALEAFDRALALDPNLPQASFYRGVQELADGQDEVALSDFRAAVLGEPAWFEARIYLAQAYLATGNPSSAFFEINAGSTLVETDVQRAMLFYWRATSLEALGQPMNAMPDWQSLLNLPSTVMPAEWRATAMARLQSN